MRYAHHFSCCAFTVARTHGVETETAVNVGSFTQGQKHFLEDGIVRSGILVKRKQHRLESERSDIVTSEVFRENGVEGSKSEFFEGD